MEGLVVNISFWKNKRVFVTGHTGFKGSWLCMWLKQLGVEVAGYSLSPTTEPSFFDVANIADGMNSVIGDIRDRHKLEQAIQMAKPEIVIHFAAQALVRYSYQHPVETYDVNVMGTVNLLEAVRTCGSVRSVLVITSDKCYENQEREAGYSENEAMGGYDPYSSSKGCTELVVSAYRQSFFSGEYRVALATARAGNVIGGGDWSEDRLIPDMVRSFTSGKMVSIRNPRSIRPWQHVFEALHGYLLLLESMTKEPQHFSQAWNFGPEDKDAKDVAWIVENFISGWGNANWQVERYVDNLHEAHILRLDCSKARHELNWKPVVDLEVALKWIANWYRCYYDGGNVVSLSHQQLEEFQGMVTV